MTCNHEMRREQHWDECVKCGARWHPDHGFNVPLSTSRHPSMFPEYPDEPRPFTLADIRAARELPRPDNSAYLAAVREFRERYQAAEREHGAVEISKLEFKRKT